MRGNQTAWEQKNRGGESLRYSSLLNMDTKPRSLNQPVLYKGACQGTLSSGSWSRKEKRSLT